MNYRHKKEYPKLLIQYQSDAKFSVEQLAPAIREITQHLSFLIDGRDNKTVLDTLDIIENIQEWDIESSDDRKKEVVICLNNIVKVTEEKPPTEYLESTANSLMRLTEMLRMNPAYFPELTGSIKKRDLKPFMITVSEILKKHIEDIKSTIASTSKIMSPAPTEGVFEKTRSQKRKQSEFFPEPSPPTKKHKGILPPQKSAK